MGGSVSKATSAVDDQKKMFVFPSVVKPIEPDAESDQEEVSAFSQQPEAAVSHDLAPAESSSDEEKESFVGWLSSSTSDLSSSVDTKSTVTMAHTQSTGKTLTVGGIGQRPSADTPLPRTSNNNFRKSATIKEHHPPGQGQVQHDDRPHSSNFSPRASLASSGTGSIAFSPGVSARSSFAVERASLEANRQSIEAFAEAWRRASGATSISQTSMVEQADPAMSFEKLVGLLGVPPQLNQRFAAMCALPLQTPVPCAMLAALWGASPAEALSTATVFAQLGIVNVAQLPNGQIWALPQAQQLQLLQAACKESQLQYHNVLLESYTNRGQYTLAEIPDDGYILTNIGYHILGAGKLDSMRQLLLDPTWLEKKLRASGPGGVVADFRRYLSIKPDKDVKLLLEAFQMSVGQVGKHANITGLLRCMLMGRLMATPLSIEMQAWLVQQQAAIKAAGAAASAVGQPHCLPPCTPSLDQAGGLQRLALRAHSAAVTKIMLTSSGTDAVTASDDGTVRLWDLEIGDCTLVLEGHTGPITQMAITEDGSLLVSASEDGTARAYELERGQCLRVLAGHEKAVTCLAVDPWGRFVVTGGRDGTVRIWDLGTAKSLHVLQCGQGTDPGEVTCLALSPCTRYVLFGATNSIVEMYDVISGQRVGMLKGHTSWVSAVAFAAGGSHALTASHDGTIRLWSLRSGRCHRVMAGHTGRINSMSVSGKLVATAGEDGTARVWDVKSGACLRVLQGHNGWVSTVVIFPGSDQVITTSGDATAITWSIDTGEVIRVLEGHSAAVLGAVVTRRGRFAVTCSEDGSLRVWDFSASSSHTPKWHEGRIRALAAADGILVATAGDDCMVRLWDATLGEYKGLLEGHEVPIRWASFSVDGRQLVTASPDHNIRTWDCESGVCVKNIPEHHGSRMKSFAACADLSIAATCLFDGSITVLDLKSGEVQQVLQARGVREESKGHMSAVNEVLITPDGSLVITLSKDFTARVWDSATGQCRFVLKGHTDGITGGCIGDSGRLLATHAYDGTVRLWSLEAGDCLLASPVPARISRMAVSPCGLFLAVALADHTVCCMSLHDESMHWTQLRGHMKEVTGLEFSEDGSRLVSVSEDGTLRVWSVATGQLWGIFVADCGLTCCHFDAKSGHVVVGTDRGVVHFVGAD